MYTKKNYLVCVKFSLHMCYAHYVSKLPCIFFYRDVDTTKVKIQLWDTAGQERY